MIAPGRSSRRERGAGAGPLLVEVMGPAGSGKTSLVRELCSRDVGIRGGLDLGKAQYVGPLLRKLGVLLPVWALHYRRDRWLDRREMRSIARLETWSRALETTTPNQAPVAVFDHGPLYRLARLREYGPALTESEPFARWWRGSLAWWLGALDIVVMLDAPDAVLLRRVDERGHWFLSADRAGGEKGEFLARYRRAFDEVLDGAPDPPMILRFRSDDASVEAIAVEVLSAIASMRSTGHPGGRSRR